MQTRKSTTSSLTSLFLVFTAGHGVIVLLQAYEDDVYLLSKDLDEKEATLHFPALGAALDVLAEAQAGYIGVKVEGPFQEWARL